MSDGSTIYALSSGRLPAAIAVIRISGPRAGDALKALIGRIPEPRRGALGRVRDPTSGEMIDEALVLWFPGPNSETGEDTAELQLHGGRAVVAATFVALGRMEGLRPAEAGEFTRRAFENGKLDLTAVEGLADLVSAETEAQRRQAFRQMKGALAAQAEAWRERLIKALALVEARIDFSDEGDVPEDLIAPALAIARDLADEIEAALADDRRGERLREGLVVAIAGPPNAGKSTLLNRIARREAAIVSPYAGTTRDVIEVHLDLQGWPVTLLDTAGIRDTADPVEMEGVRRARERAAKADLVLWVEDAREAGGAGGSVAARLGPVLGGKDAGERGASGAAVAAKPDLMLRGDDAGEAGTSGAAVAAEADPVLWTGNAGERDAFGATRPAKADSVLDDASEPGARGLALQGAPGLAIQGEPGFSPLVWRLRNKIDLLTDAGRKNELVSDSSLNNESKNNEMKPSFADLKSRFVDKNESLFQESELEFNISAASGFGLDRLLTELIRAAERFLAQAEPALITRDRHRRSLTHCLAALRRVISEFDGREEILGEELRSAAHALACLTGRVDVEDVLDVIFRDFCIGK